MRQRKHFILLLYLFAATLFPLFPQNSAAKKNPPPIENTKVAPEEIEEEHEGFPLFWQVSLREEPGYAMPRKSALLNPGDVLGLPRIQNRVLASLDAKVPIVGGSGINPILEFVIADTFLYLQYEGHETVAKPTLSHAQNFLKEAYLNLRPASFWLMSAGRRNVTDGVGYSRNLVDYLATPTTLPGFNLDNRVRIKNREGTILWRNEFFWKGGSFAYTYVPSIQATAYNDVRVATEIDRITQFNRTDAHWLKVYEYIAGFDVSLHYFYRERHKAGLALAKVLGDALELHGEVNVQQGTNVLVPYKIQDDAYIGSTLVQAALYNYTERGNNTYYVRSLVGGQYTFENKLNFSLEYYYNGEGYSSAEQKLLYDALGVSGARYNNPAFALGPKNPYWLFLMAANQNFNYLSTGSHYVFMRLFNPEFFGSQKWEAALYTSVLVTDGSGLLAGDVTYKWTDYISLQFLVNSFWGNKKSEGGLFYESFSALAALEAQF
ncbi:MAG TPA: hypothetical protein PLY93_02445 [Turneriella sp.]|nr:hypothetical protein [Turneriella sp.]